MNFSVEKETRLTRSGFKQEMRWQRWFLCSVSAKVTEFFSDASSAANLEFNSVVASSNWPRNSVFPKKIAESLKIKVHTKSYYKIKMFTNVQLLQHLPQKATDE